MVLQCSFSLFKAPKRPRKDVRNLLFSLSSPLSFRTEYSLLFCSYGAERFEDGASQINKSDMFFGDDGNLTDEQLEHMDKITMKNAQFVKMSEGDVVLLDNYKCMHGRNVFEGTRKHAVAWFEGWEGEEEMKQPTKEPFFASSV